MNKVTRSDGWVRNPDGTPGWTANPITGCLKGCPYCFARSLANGRLKRRYLANSILPSHDETEHNQHHADPFYPRFWPSALYDIETRRKPSGIFLNIMGEWAGDWLPRTWQTAMFDSIKRCPQHLFYLLTKQPQNLADFSPYPDNCRVGVSVTADGDMSNAYYGLDGIEAKAGRFISVEPLLGTITMKSHRILEVVDQVIVGAMSCYGDFDRLSRDYSQLTPMLHRGHWTLQPRIEWVSEVVKAAMSMNVPVYLKDNLMPLLEDRGFMDPLYWRDGYYTSMEHPNVDLHLRQEMPGRGQVC